MLADKQLFLNIPFQSIKNKKKVLCVDIKLQKNIEDVYRPTCRNEKSVHI